MCMSACACMPSSCLAASPPHMKVIVTDVADGSAASGHVMKGDKVLAINGTPVTLSCRSAKDSEHAAMTELCWIPLASLRKNSITELNLGNKGVGVPGALVLSKLLPSATALRLIKCAASPGVVGPMSAPIDAPTLLPFLPPAPRSQSLGQWIRRRGRHCARCHPPRDRDHRPEVRRLPGAHLSVNAH